MKAWRTEARPLRMLEQTTVQGLRQRLEAGELSVLDVRQPAEWMSGHIDGASFVTGGELPSRLDEVPDGPLAVVCGSGYRSSVAASLLLAEGFEPIVNVLGGMTAWTAADYPTTEEEQQS
jgi:hydroxyacylglutathione hydrolase